MDEVLTTASRIRCNHLPPLGVLTVGGSSRLTVAGAPVLLVGAPATITVCGQQVNPPPPAVPTTKPCTTVGAVSSAPARLRVDGRPVLLAGSFTATTDGLPPPAFQVDPIQRVLRAGGAGP